MSVQLRIYLILSILLLSLIGILTVVGVISQNQAVDIGGKAILTLVIVGGAGFLMGAVSGSKKSQETDKDQKQGPQF